MLNLTLIVLYNSNKTAIVILYFPYLERAKL